MVENNNKIVPRVRGARFILESKIATAKMPIKQALACLCGLEMLRQRGRLLFADALSCWSAAGQTRGMIAKEIRGRHLKPCQARAAMATGHPPESMARDNLGGQFSHAGHSGCVGQKGEKIHKKLLHFAVVVILLAVGGRAFGQGLDSSGDPVFKYFTPATGDFTFTSATRIVINHGGQDLADILNAPRGVLEHLRHATGFNLPVVMSVASPLNSDIVLTMAASTFGDNAVYTVNISPSTATKDISDLVKSEGFTYSAGQNQGVTLAYIGNRGAIRAVQSLVNIIMQDGNNPGAHNSIPYGTGTDYPHYETRSVMLDVGRHFIPTEMILAYLEKMSLHRLNVLHMHLNDNTRPAPADGVGVDSGGRDHNQKVGYFRLDIGDVDRQNRMTPDGHYYTKDDWDKIEQAALRYGITVVPEFDGPGHALAWLQDDTSLPTSNDGNRENSMSTRTRAALVQNANYMISMIMSYRSWFASDTFHIGMDEGFGNQWVNSGTRTGDVYWGLEVANGIRYSSATNPDGFRRIQIWHEAKHNISDILSNAPDVEFHQWFLTRNPSYNANTKWHEATTGRYWVPGYTGYPGANSISSLFNGHIAGGLNEVINTRSMTNLPVGVVWALWNDWTPYVFGNFTHGVNSQNWGITNTGIPLMGALGWYGHTKRNGSGNLLQYADLDYGDLLSPSQEFSSFLIRRRFPYVTDDSLIMKILLDPARHRVLVADSGGSWSTQSLNDGSKTSDWMGWDTEDMEKSFAGPSSFAGLGMVEANLAGEGEDGCFDSGIDPAFAERQVSACDEDTWSNDIVGSGGGLIKKGIGHLRLLGANSFDGGLVVEGGILEIGADESLGATNGLVTLAGGTLSFSSDVMLANTRNLAITAGGVGAINANGNVIDIQGVISGNNSTLKISSTQKVTMTTMQAKELVGGGGTVTVMAPVISRIVTMSAPGTVSLRGVNTFSGGLILESGVLAASAVNNLGAGGLSFSGGTLNFAANFTNSKAAAVGAGEEAVIEAASGRSAVMSGVISGFGGLRKTGVGSLELRGTNTYRGQTKVEGGMLVGDISTIPDASIIRVDSGAVLELTQSSDGKHDGNIFGPGLVRKRGSNMLRLNGASSAPWEISEGTLVSNGSFAGNIAFAGSGARKFEFNQSNNLSYAGVLSGDGSVVKKGGGALVLTGDSNSFAGDFAVDSNSTLFIDSMLGGDVSVMANGVLGGEGKVGGNVMVASSGKLADSRVKAGLTVGGNLVLAGEYEVNFGKGLVVEGDSDISAGSLKVLGGVFSPFDFDNDRSDNDNSQFNVLQSSGALTGEFSSVDTSDLPFMAVSISYRTAGTGGTVRLAAGLNRQAVENLLGINNLAEVVIVPDQTPNPEENVDEQEEMMEEEQQQPEEVFVEMIEKVVSSAAPYENNHDDLVRVLLLINDAREEEQSGSGDALLNDFSKIIMTISDDANVGSDPYAKTAEQKEQELTDSMLAEPHAAIKSASFSVASTELQNVSAAQTRTSFNALGGGQGQSRFNLNKKQWGFKGGGIDPAIWFKAIGIKAKNNGGENYNRLEYKGGTYLIGGDASLSKNLRLGGFVGVSRLEFSQPGTQASGLDKSRNFGAYSGMRWKKFLFLGGLSFTRHDTEASRIAMMENVSSKYKAKTLGVFGETGYRFEIGDDDNVVEPFWGISYARHEQDARDELRDDDSKFGTIHETKSNMSTMETGIRLETPAPEGISARGKMYGVMSWNFFLKQPEVSVPQTLGNTQYALPVRTAPVSPSSFNLKAGIDFNMGDNSHIVLNAGYSRTFGEADEKYVFDGKFTYSF